MTPLRLPDRGSERRTLARGVVALAVAAGLGVAAPGRAADEPASAAETAAWAALRAPGAIALMRHAQAPGIGDPTGWRIDDCSTQRNLDDTGRADARAAGARLRRHRVAFAQVLSSPWCRCLETARLLDVGAVQTEPTFGNAYVMSDQRSSLTDGGGAVLRRWRGPGRLLVVTHNENIQALTGASVAPGEMLVVRVAADGTLAASARLPAPLRSP